MKSKEGFLSILGLKSKFIIIYALIVAFILTMTAVLYYTTTNKILYNIVTNDSVALLDKINQVIDQKFELISEYSNGLKVDNDLLNYLDKYYATDNVVQIYEVDRYISQLLNKYFLYSNEIFSINLVTKRTVFGQTAYPTIIPVDNFEKTDVFRLALEAHGKTVWIPTYDFFEMFSQRHVPSIDVPYQKMFSAVKLVNKHEDDYAVLVLNLSDDIYRKNFSKLSNYVNGKYLVVAPDGTIVSHSDQTLLGTTLDEEWLSSAFIKKSGYKSIELDGESYIVCFDTSEKTGWLLCLILEKDMLMKDYVKIIMRNMLLILAFLILIPLIVIMFISKSILNPIELIRKGMKESAQGNFNISIREAGAKELRKLIRGFNTMNSHIQNLIRENYEMIIMKKEAELNAYNLQLNPHFISNSLNLINLELIKRGEYDLSDMVAELSEMMHYTLKSSGNLVSFEEDWQHTLSYIKVMQRRHNKQFEVHCNIDPELYKYTVPKFFLQPLVENSVVHGFEGINYKGTIRISAFIKDNKRYFTIEDNGKGIDESTKNKILNDENKSIGINNIRYRVKYIYGDEYEISIDSAPYALTKITVVLPLS